MLPKLICFIFGHDKYWNEFSGQTETLTSPLTGQPTIYPISIRRKNEICPRCGKLLLKVTKETK